MTVGLTGARRPAAVPVDDEVLVERSSRGDEQAFAALYRRYARYVAGVAYRLMGDTLELDDIVQETFVAASSRLHQLKDGSSVRSWLMTIAVRRVNRRLAARQRRRWLGQEIDREFETVSDQRVRAELDELYDVLDRMPARLRVPWVLARIEGEALGEVAKICNISLATVKRRVAQAEQSVQRRLNAR
jgi:RNA polymerase sigma-70 factor (ECF subfamily)